MAKILKFPTVIQLLDNRKIDKSSEDQTITHTALGEPKLNVYPGKYNIKGEELEDFLQLYYMWIFEWNQQLHLTEKHNEDKCPVLIDLDFRYENDGTNDRKYSEEDIVFFIEKYFKVLGKYLKFTDKQMETFILEKSSPVEDSKNKEIMKDGVHIIIPYIVSNYNVLHLVRNDIIQDSEISDKFEELGFKNPLEDIVDKAVIQRNNWFMYGSSKPGKEPYLVTYIIDSKKGKFSVTKGTKNYSSKELVSILSINNQLDENTCILNLPEEDITAKYDKIFGKKKKSGTPKSEEDIKQTTENLELIKQIVGILKPSRAENFQEWIELGWCLHNIHNIDNTLLDTWIEFSMKSSKFEYGVCEQKWEEMRDNGLGIGTLYRWAQQDNITAYNRIMRDDIENLIKASLSKCHYDIAKVVHKLYKHEFKCVNNKNWYQYNNHRWNFIGDGVELKKRLSEQIVQEFCNYAGKCNQIIQQLTDETQQETYIKRGKMAFEISSKLKDVPFKKNIMECCTELFHEREFADMLDSNVNLIGFKNGVYDLERREFRDGYPDDNIFYNTGINYKEFEETDILVKQVRTFLAQVLPIPRVRTYVLKVMASMLSGKTGEEKFHIWTGCHAKGSKIMLHSGETVKVEEVKEGDALMGPDSKPRVVKRLVRGQSEMYEIKPSKGDKFVVNGGHVMVLEATNIGSIVNSDKENRVKLAWQEKDENGFPVNKCKNFPYKSETKKIYRKEVEYSETKEEAIEKAKEYETTLKDKIQDGDRIEIPVEEYLSRKKKIGERNYYLVKSKVDFEEKKTEIDPYLYGLWLGDGSSNDSAITNMDEEVLDYCKEIAEKYNLKIMTYSKENTKAVTLRFSAKQRGKYNKMYDFLKKNNLFKNKHILDTYKYNSSDIRLQILAGLLDTDGNYQKSSKQFEITQKSEKLSKDIKYIAESLGYCVSYKKCVKECNGKEGDYYRIIISGENLQDIPTKIPRKIASDRTINKCSYRYGFKINQVEDGDYYGFTLDKDHLYLTEDFMVHHNCGGNGKSKIIELFEAAFGDYCGKMPVTVLTRPRGNSGDASPELVKNKGKRFVTLQEPDDNEKIHVGAMKELTGGDKIQARGLFKDPIEFKPQWKIVMTSNVLPEVSANDRGTWRRIRVTEYISRFVDPNDITPNPEKNEFPIDYDLSTKLQKWPEAFMYILIKYYHDYMENGNPEPAEVTKAGDEYKKQSDIFLQFMTDNITENNNEKLSLDEIYNVFREWFKTSGHGGKLPLKKDLENNITQIYGPPTRGKWKGITTADMNPDEDDDEDDDDE